MCTESDNPTHQEQDNKKHQSISSSCQELDLPLKYTWNSIKNDDAS